MYDAFKSNTVTKNTNNKRTIGSSASIILGQFFKNILSENKITSSNDLDFLMTRFVGDPKNGYPQDRRSISSARGNLRKELFNTDMSWLVFCKGLRFIRIQRFTLTIKAEYTTGHVKEHSVSVDLNVPDDPEQETNEPEPII